MKRFTAVLLFIVALSIPAFCPANSIFDRALVLFQWKYYDDAIIELNRIIPDDKEPWYSRAEFLKGRCLLAKGDAKSARDIFLELAVSTSFKLPDYTRFYLAETYYSEKKWQDAYNIYKDIPHGSVLWPDSVIRRAECLEQLKDLNLAIETYKALIAENSDTAPLDRARFGLGRCYEKAGNFKAAISSYHQINLYSPMSPVAKDAMGRIAAISRSYKIYPDAASAEELFNKAMVYYNFGDFGSAGMFFQQIVNGYRTSGLWDDALFKSAMCDYKRKRISSSIAKFKILVSKGGSYADQAQFYMAFAYGKSGYFYQTLDCLSKVINNYPGSAFADDAYFYLGYYYDVNGFKDNAYAYFTNFVRLYPDSEFAPEAYWKIGRAYYFKREYPLAYEAFKEATEKCKKGSMLDACTYWKGLVQEKLGNSGDAAECYRDVIRKFDHTYYSYRAREKLAALGSEVKDDQDFQSTGLPVVGEEEFADVPFTEEPLPFDGGIEESSSSDAAGTVNKAAAEEHFRKYSELMAMGFYDDAAREAQLMVKYSDESKKTSAKLAVASANLAAGKVRESIIFAENLCNNSIMDGSSRGLPRQTWQLAYPLGYYNHVAQYAAQFGIDENLVLAVIREESRFNPKTVSWANARGLMQLIPQTGLNVARLIGIRPYYTSRLHDPDVNIKMGCYYLSQLLKRFNGNKVLAVAAYNGGPLRVQKWYNKWIAQTGEVDMDEFVESIPLSETRRYVQKVLKSYNEYKRLYTNKYPIITSKS